MKQIPTQLENPSGLHQRYYIQKVIPVKELLPSFPKKYELQDTDEGSEYFVMRLDEGGKDINHIKACRVGVHAYANAIEPFIPELAKDLRERYPLL